MKFSYIAAALFGASLSISAIAAPVATVNGTPIPRSELDSTVNVLVKSGQVKDSPALREEVKTRLINREIIIQEAKHRGLQNSAAYKTRIDEFGSDLLQEMLFADVLKKSPVTDADAKKIYDEINKKYAGGKELLISQIVVKSEPEAKTIISELKSGKSFGSLAKAKSIDPNAKHSGGKLPSPIPAKDLEKNPALANALSGLTKGKFSQAPVSQGENWFVFKVDDIRSISIQPYSKMKPQIIHNLQQQKVAKVVADLRSKAKIQ